ncbi:hypothetical protein NQ315_006118 [Exocentrus adspersus]
MKRLS